MKKFIGVLVALTVSCVVYAVSTEKKAPTTKANFNKDKIVALVETNTRLKVDDVVPSSVEGLVEVVTSQGSYFASRDGKYFIPKIFVETPGAGFADIFEERNAEKRIAGVKSFEKDMIVYPAENEKHVITVFTDITCGYCRKMHNLMDEYNALGITVRYLAYPRHGIRGENGDYTKGFKDLRSIWCHENPAEAMTKAKAGRGVAERICDAPIEAEFNFGQQVGVNGTPAIVLESGFMLPGFREPKDLSDLLAQM